MEIKGALTTAGRGDTETRGHGDMETRRYGEEDLRYYLPCPLRKNRARIPVTVCHKQKCLFLGSENGKPKCKYGDQNACKK